MLDVDVSDRGQKPEHNSGIAFPVIRTEHWKRAFTNVKESEQLTRMSTENQNIFGQVNVRVPPKLYEPTKEERQSRCPFRSWCEVRVKAKSPDGRHTKQLVDREHMPVIEFVYAFPTDPPGDLNRKILMMIATDSIHGSIFAVVARRKDGQNDYVILIFQHYNDRLALLGQS